MVKAEWHCNLYKAGGQLYHRHQSVLWAATWDMAMLGGIAKTELHTGAQ